QNNHNCYNKVLPSETSLLHCRAQIHSDHLLENFLRPCFKEWHATAIDGIHLPRIDVQQGDLSPSTACQHNSQRQAHVTTTSHDNYVSIPAHSLPLVRTMPEDSQIPAPTSRIRA